MHRRLRIAAPFAAITLVLSLTLGGTAVAAEAHGQHPKTSGLAGAGQTASRSAVPFSQVGPGWTLVTYTTATPFAARPKTGATTLYLVDPAGGKYVMYRWPHVSADGGVNLLAWSGDGQRAMLDVQKGGADELEQLTLATGRLSRLPLPASALPISYTRPDGLAVLAYRLVLSPVRIQLVRYNLTGGLEKVLFTLKTKNNNGGAFVNLSQSPYNPSGTEIALTAPQAGATGKQHLVLISNAGGLTRQYGWAGSCQLVAWWTAHRLLTMNCAGRRLFLTPVSGGKPAPLTPARMSANEYVRNAWSLAGHVYVQLSGPACGSGSLAVMRRGRLADVAVPTVRFPSIVTAGASKLLVVAQSCMGSSGLLWFNPRTSAEVKVLRRNQGQGVIGLVPYYALNGG
jgi:hypothetical protein